MAGTSSIGIMDAVSWQATLEAMQIVHAEDRAPAVAAIYEEILARRALARLQQGRVPPEVHVGVGGGVLQGSDGTMRLAVSDKGAGGGFADRLARGWFGLTRDHKALADKALKGDALALDQWLTMAEKNQEAREHLISMARGQEAIVAALAARAETSDASRDILWQVAEQGDGQALRSSLGLSTRIPAFQDHIRDRAKQNSALVDRLAGQIDVSPAREILFDLAATSFDVYGFLITLASDDEDVFNRVIDLAVGNRSRVHVLAGQANASGRALEALTRAAERDVRALETLMRCDRFASVVAELDISGLLPSIKEDVYGEPRRVLQALVRRVRELVSGGHTDLAGYLTTLERAYHLALLPELVTLVREIADFFTLFNPAENFQPANYVLIRFHNGQMELRLAPEGIAHEELVLRGHGENAIAEGRIFYHAKSNTLLFDDKISDFALTTFVRERSPETRSRPAPLTGLVGKPVAELDFLVREREIVKRTHQGVRTLLSAHDILVKPRRCVWVRRASGEVEARLIPVLTAPETVVSPDETLVAVGLLRSPMKFEFESGDAESAQAFLRHLPGNPEVVFGPLFDVNAEIAQKTQGAGFIVTSGDQIQLNSEVNEYKLVVVINYAGKMELRLVPISIATGGNERYSHPDLLAGSDLAIVGASWLERRQDGVIVVRGSSGYLPTDEDRYVGRGLPAASQSGLRVVREFIATRFGEKVSEPRS